MPGHNIQHVLEYGEFTTSARVFNGPEGYVFGFGTTVGNGMEGWAPGAIFIDTNAGAGARVHVNTNTNTSATWTVNAGEVLSNQTFLNLPLGGWTEQDGTAIVDFTTDSTTPGWNAADETFGIRWHNQSAPDPITTSVPIPPDLDADSDVIVHIMGAKTGATAGDTVDWLIEAFNNVDAALYDADTDFGGTASSMTGNATAKTVQEETLTLAAADVAGSPCVLTLTLQPKDGKLGTDDVILLGVWLEYTRKVLTT